MLLAPCDLLTARVECRQVQAAQITQRDCSKCHSALTLLYSAATFALASDAGTQGRTARPRQRQRRVRSGHGQQLAVRSAQTCLLFHACHEYPSRVSLAAIHPSRCLALCGCWSAGSSWLVLLAWAGCTAFRQSLGNAAHMQAACMLMQSCLQQTELPGDQASGVAPGKALPATGTCKHYAHSHRCLH